MSLLLSGKDRPFPDRVGTVAPLESLFLPGLLRSESQRHDENTLWKGKHQEAHCLSITGITKSF